MRIAIVGGTGGLGGGLALRWARFGHDIIIGSRESRKGQKCRRRIQKDIIWVRHRLDIRP